MSRDRLDGAPIPALALRGDVVAYANRAAGALLGVEPAALVGQPVARFLPDDARDRVRARRQRRLRGEPEPSEYESTVVAADGRRIEVEVSVAVHDGEVLAHLRDVSDRAHHRERLDALARLGARVQGERTRGAVLQAVREGLSSIGLGCALLRPRGDELVLEFAQAPAGAAAPPDATALAGFLAAGRWTEALEAVWRDGAVFLDDLPGAAERFLGGQAGGRARDVARAADAARCIAARVDEGGRPAAVIAMAAGWLRTSDLPALRLFASQVTAALEAARSLAEIDLRRAELEARDVELDARNRVVEVAANAPSLPEFFARGLEVVRQVVGCSGVAVWLLDEARGELVLGHSLGATPETVAAHVRVPLDAANTGSVVRSGVPAVFQVEAFTEPSRSLGAASGFVTVASVPLRVRSRTVGVVNAGFAERRDEATARLRLLAMLAGPFAAAVETQRLFDDLRRSYGELERAQRQLVHRERLTALGELSAVIAHEIRNPLAVVFNSLGSLQRILRPQGDAKLLLDVIQEEADRLNRTVGDLLDFARPSEPSPRPEPLDRLVEEALAAALPQQPHGLVVHREHDPALPPVAVDARQVRQAVLNLIVNAVQAMPRGGALTVRSAADGAQARLEVSDTGPGVPEGLRHRVFEPFFTTKATGTGLGLAVVRRIAESHGGSAEALEAPGGGARFVLRLPLEPPAPVEISGGIRSDRSG